MEDKKQEILRHLSDLESLKRKPNTSSELRGGNQMSRLQRMQDKSFEKKRSIEEQRLRELLKSKQPKKAKRLTGLDILDGGAEEELNLFDDFVFNKPKRTEVQKKRAGGRWLF